MRPAEIAEAGWLIALQLRFLPGYVLLIARRAAPKPPNIKCTARKCRGSRPKPPEAGDRAWPTGA